MGANIKVEGNSAIIDGVRKLTGARVSAPDLRAGAALVIAGLAADGVTVVDDIVYIQRGYENFEEKLRSLGAEIERVSSEKEIQKFRLRVGYSFFPFVKKKMSILYDCYKSNRERPFIQSGGDTKDL